MRAMVIDSFPRATSTVLICLFVVGSVRADLAPGIDEEKHSWTEYSYEPYPFPYYVEDVDRYPASTPPQGTVNRHGELEYIGSGIFGAHWFVDAGEAVWHFVTAGDPSNEVVLLIHGHPDTWYAFSKVMAQLADTYYVIAVDTPSDQS